MATPSKGIFIVGAKRTPFCKYGGSLREMPASHVFAAAARDAIQSANVDPSVIDHTIVGNVNFLSQCDGGKTPRYCGIYSGVDISRPALGVNKACGSGLQAVVSGALEILTGIAKVTLTGGTELMSSLPHLVRHARFGTTLGEPYQFEDYIKTQFLDSYTGLTMEKVAEDVARKNGVKREEADQYAIDSYLKWKAATNKFNNELTAVRATIRKKEVIVQEDELPELEINSDRLATLPATLDDGSVVTAGNSARPADGAAALLLADAETVSRHQLSPLARVAAWACVGTDPNTGLGGVAAVEKLLNVTGIGRNQVDLFEINDIFASQVLVSIRLLDIDPGHLNVDGGAVTLGHPVAATGARIAVHLVHELRRRNLKRGVAATSCGGGQGIAVLLETM